MVWVIFRLKSIMSAKLVMVNNASPQKNPNTARSSWESFFENRWLQRYPGMVKRMRPRMSLRSSTGSTGIGVLYV